MALQAATAGNLTAFRIVGYPHPGTMRVERLDPTPRGWVMQIEERWSDENGAPWYCREMFRADVTDGLVSDLAIYCCGDLPGPDGRRPQHLRPRGSRLRGIRPRRRFHRARYFAASRRLAVDLMRGRLDTAEYLRGLARDAAGRVFIADHEAVLHAMTATGSVCRYEPNLEAPVRWILGESERQET
jgi:hypothetical protein